MNKRIVIPTTVAVAVLVAFAAAILVQADDDSYGVRPSLAGAPMMGAMMGGSGPAGWAGLDESGYLTEMVAHHREAVAAARELERSDRPGMRALGASIVASQSAQIREMEGWLAAWYPDAAPADYRPMMRDLSGLEGGALDRAFLADMIPHHMAAVMMSQHLLISGAVVHDEVADLAATIRDDQRREIVTMLRWERAWGWGSLRPAGGPPGAS